MTKLLILADDLTGALDTGVQFAKRGLTTGVLIYQNDAPICMGEWEVVVYDLESRHVSPAEAYRRVKRTIFAAKDVPYLFKKVDSTQRGNVGIELEAAMDASGKQLLVYSPSYPAQNRIVVNGVLYVNGIKLLDSDFLHDRFSTICSSYLPEIIAAQSSRSSHVTDPEHLHEMVDTADIMVVDASTDNDLKSIVKTLLEKYGENVIYSGSAGLAKALAEQLGSTDPLPVPDFPRGKAMVVCGSLNSNSRKQIVELERYGVPSVCLNESSLLMEGELGSAEVDMLFLQVYNLLRNHEAVVLKHDYDETHAIPKMSADALEDSQMPRHIRIAIGTGKLACRVMRKLNLSQMIVVGGDTLFGVLQSLHYVCIMPRFELLPGVIYSEIHLSNGSVFAIISKAGGFGSDDTLNYVVRHATNMDKYQDKRTTV